MASNYSIRVVNQGKTQKYRLQNSTSELLIGRANQEGMLNIDNDSLSRQHAKLIFGNGKVQIVDLNSSNGTYIRGKRLSANSPTTIQANEKVYLLPDQSVYLEWFSEAEKPKSSDATTKNTKGLLAYLQNKEELLIGRSEDCDIVLDDLSVSRKHAKVYRKNGKIYIKDLNSSNGVFINNKRIHQARELKATDTLFIGLYAFKLHEKPQDYSKENAISTHQITKVFKNGYVGLQAASLQIPYQRVVALMGPSGCGKSTLLKALNGDSPPTEGQVKIFGLDMATHFEMLKHIIGYVPQDNIVHEDLTVQQSLFFAAKLRLSADLSKSQIEQRITEVLDSLKINNPVIRKTKVAKLSGGQKKRVSIAVELLNKPKILFLDEPTSPLDPETIEEFLLCLRNLCKQGTTVIMVTHKPADLNYTDQVVFMGVQGHIAYNGVQDQLISHFQQDSIIKLYGLLSEVQQAKKWYQRWADDSSNQGLKGKKIEVKKPAVNPFRQTFWLSMRYISIKAGNLKNLIIMLMQPVLIALLVIFAFDSLFTVETIPPGVEMRTPNVGILFLMAIAAVWFGVSNSAKEIVGEQAIVKREFMLNMKLGTYLSSKVLVLTLISAIQLLLLLIFLYFKFDDLTAFFSTWLFMMLVSICSIQFGLLLSSFSSSSEEVMSILPIALMPQIILAGMIQPIENQATLFLSYVTLGRWGTEGIARIQDFSDEEEPFMTVLDQNLYQEEVGSIFPTDSMAANNYALLILFILMGTAVFLILLNKLKPKS